MDDRSGAEVCKHDFLHSFVVMEVPEGTDYVLSYMPNSSWRKVSSN